MKKDETPSFFQFCSLPVVTCIKSGSLSHAIIRTLMPNAGMSTDGYFLTAGDSMGNTKFTEFLFSDYACAQFQQGAE